MLKKRCLFIILLLLPLFADVLASHSDDFNLSSLSNFTSVSQSLENESDCNDCPAPDACQDCCRNHHQFVQLSPGSVNISSQLFSQESPLNPQFILIETYLSTPDKPPRLKA